MVWVETGGRGAEEAGGAWRGEISRELAGSGRGDTNVSNWSRRVPARGDAGRSLGLHSEGVIDPIFSGCATVFWHVLLHMVLDTVIAFIRLVQILSL